MSLLFRIMPSSISQRFFPNSYSRMSTSRDVASPFPPSAIDYSSDDSEASTPESLRGMLWDDKESFPRRRSSRIWRKRIFGKRVIFWCGLLLVSALSAILIYLSLLFHVPQKHAPKSPSSGINSLIKSWKAPEDSVRLLSPWSADFTKDITPLACHSHNDYWRKVPLFDALAAGCTSIEADIWLDDKDPSRDMLVGHSHWSLESDRTLQSMYINPLITILDRQNYGRKSKDHQNPVGIFSSSPNTTITLFLDFKNSGARMWPHVNQQLEILRSKKYLSHWDSNTKRITWRPIIIVASGDAPFDLIASNDKYRDIFYDAPLDDISNPKYNDTNSYYASVSMMRSIGFLWTWRFRQGQLSKIKAQIDAAKAKNLIPRYWGTPTFPWKLNEYIWGILIENGIGLLNVDEFTSSLFYPLMTRFGQNRLLW